MRIAVFASGRGSNLAALLVAEKEGRIAPAEIQLVLSNQADAGALTRAKEAHKPAVLLAHQNFSSREDYDQAALAILREYAIDAIVLAGFMRIITPVLIDAFPQRILNVHPSLLPAFPGIDAQKQALKHGAKVTGCTVHLVDSDVDTGPIVLQAAVPILEGDNVDRLSARILDKEHELLPKAVALLAANRLSVSGRRVKIRTKD